MNDTMIPLHPTKGLDPHLMQCPMCGGEANGLTIGHMKKLMFCDKIVGYAQVGKTTKVRRDVAKHLTAHNDKISEGHGHVVTEWDIEVVSLEENEKVFDFEPCDKCREKIAVEKEAHAKVVAKGGVYWRCEDCSLTGVLRPSDFTKDVRRSAGVGLTDSCGVQFNRHDKDRLCPSEILSL